MLIIGLHGKAGAGKDTTASLLQSFLPEGSTRTVAFAKPLKDAAKAKFGLTDWHVNTQEGKKELVPALGKTVRQLLELEGTEATRDVYGSNFWIWRMSQEVDKAFKENIKIFIITDVRFENEAEFIRDNGGLIFQIDRELKQELATVTHASAKTLPPHLVNIFVPNNGTIEDLKKEVKDLANVIKEHIECQNM